MSYFLFLSGSPRLYENHERRVSLRLRGTSNQPAAPPSTSDLSNSRQPK